MLFSGSACTCHVIVPKLSREKKTFNARSALRNQITIRGGFSKADNALLMNAGELRECVFDKMDS